MASESQVRKYLAYWFQLGKKVLIRSGSEGLLPQTVIAGDRYSPEFEECWQKIISPDSQDSYLQGTDETIAQLLTSAWDISPCARCAMPIPLRDPGMPPELCPCNDLDNWPNTEIPQPRSPVSTKLQLSSMCDRLRGNDGE
ncbi:hypothetical protein [Tychonema sp. BBK16]|uniref:hypothetical protein n=1 Tax=Tychonema sp. BBK16 TaxID=2699888 RepID=UPI001F3F634F|nr:hypothetical protein [Tychonema sp. BBK16]MCF6375791.1 hypothetical protein [Tychonema sp. BBK16]